MKRRAHQFRGQQIHTMKWKDRCDLVQSRYHRESPYHKNGIPDFRQLARQYPEFSVYVFSRGGENGSKRARKVYTIDWGDSEAVLALCRVLLRHDFDLKWNQPLRYLVPRVPSRVDYLCWVAYDLLKWRPSTSKKSVTSVRALDIGTGASCVYPLLGCRLFADWAWVGSDVDSSALSVAQENVTRNKLGGRIRLRTGSLLSGILPYSDDQGNTWKFNVQICNPPFFAAEAGKSGRIRSAMTTSEGETVGGELSFARTLFEESKLQRDQVRWFSVLLAVESDKSAFVDTLMSSNERPVMASHRMCHGADHRPTYRWIIAWSWHKDDTEEGTELQQDGEGPSAKKARTSTSLTEMMAGAE